MVSRRKFLKEVKLTAVRRVQAGEAVARLARELEMTASYTGGAASGSSSGSAPFRQRAQVDGGGAGGGAGDARSGSRALEIDFLKRALQRVEEQRQLRALAVGAPSTNKSEEVKAARGLTVQGMCHLAEVSRAGFYRRWLPAVVPADEVALRDAVQRVALEWPAYGSRRISRELHQRGWMVNRKRVQRMMREDNLSASSPPVRGDHRLESRSAGVPQPGANHGADRHQSTLAGRHHVPSPGRGVRLSGGDSGRLLAAGDRLGRWTAGLSAELTILAGEMALAQRGAPGLVHHSDWQYA